MRLLKFLLTFFASLLFLLAIQQYLLCPQYDFSRAGKFKGNKWYNPYEGLQTGWDKYNFHSHTKAWYGLTNGKGYESDVFKRYKELGYKKGYVSNYHHPSKNSLLAVYEHGFNLQKTHQQVIGNANVVWIDYFLPQTRYNKQYILERLYSKNNCLISLNHPLLTGGYSEEDMQYLDNYQLMEVLHPYIDSKSSWDEALSNGKPVFNICNDDLHNIYLLRESGRYCTMLPNTLKNETGIVEELKWGRNYGIKISYHEEETESERTNRIKSHLPELKKLQLINECVYLNLNQQASKIIFIADNGRVRKTVLTSDSAQYHLNNEDSYVRIEAYFPDGSEIAFNPVYRYKNHPLEGRTVNSNKSLLKTMISSIFGYTLLLTWLLYMFRITPVKKISFALLRNKLQPILRL